MKSNPVLDPDMTYRNKEWLYEQYWVLNKPISSIAEECGVSESCIYKYILKVSKTINIPLKKSIGLDTFKNEEWLRNEYSIKSTIVIAKECGVSPSTISRCMKEFNIKSRTISEAKKGKPMPEDTKIKISIANRGKQNSLGYKHTKESKLKIGAAAKGNKWNVGKKSSKETREKQSRSLLARLGGVSFLPYCSKFNRARREEIRIKFGRVCFICGKTEDENGQRLDVHHCDYNKGQGCGTKWNLVALCSSCHGHTGGNRWYWFNLLSNYWLCNQSIHLNENIFYYPFSHNFI